MLRLRVLLLLCLLCSFLSAALPILFLSEVYGLLRLRAVLLCFFCFFFSAGLPIQPLGIIKPTTSECDLLFYTAPENRDLFRDGKNVFLTLLYHSSDVSHRQSGRILITSRIQQKNQRTKVDNRHTKSYPKSYPAARVPSGSDAFFS